MSNTNHTSYRQQYNLLSWVIAWSCLYTHVVKIILLKMLLLCYRCLNGSAPWYLTYLLLPPPKMTWNLCWNMVMLELNVPRFKRLWDDRALSVAAPHLWNNLPYKIGATHSNTFKSLLKIHVFHSSYKAVLPHEHSCGRQIQT